MSLGFGPIAKIGRCAAMYSKSFPWITFWLFLEKKGLRCILLRVIDAIEMMEDIEQEIHVFKKNKENYFPILKNHWFYPIDEPPSIRQNIKNNGFIKK